MKAELLERRGDAHVLPLVGMRVDQCRVSVGCIEYHFEDRELPTTLSFFKRFAVSRWKQERKVDPAEMESVQPALMLVGTSLVEATASPDGTLGLWYPDGSLRAEPVAQAYRTWEFRRGDGLVMYCAGGGLVVESLSHTRGPRGRSGGRGGGG